MSGLSRSCEVLNAWSTKTVAVEKARPMMIGGTTLKVTVTIVKERLKDRVKM